MASNSDMFDYLLPIKRRKYSFSSDLTQKYSEEVDSVLYAGDFDTKIVNQNDKNTADSELNPTEYYAYEAYQAKHKIPENRKEQQEKLRVTSHQIQNTTDSTITSNATITTTGTSQSEMSVFFEDCVNELMNKNGFLLPVNHNHQHEDYFDEEDDDEEDDDEDEYDDDDCDEDEGFGTCENSATSHLVQNPLHTNENLRVKARNIRWVRKQILAGVHPLEIRSLRLPHISDMLLWSIITRALSDPPRRMPLMHIKTIDDVVHLLKTSKNIIVLTGAGVSVSCGIPDFRSRDGIYSRLAIDYPDLPDPQAMFSISYFNQDPRPFFKFAREIYPGQFKPSPCHRFIKLLEKKQKLLRNYTQNIDTLEQIAGINNVIECHGSFATATCTRCRTKVSANKIREEIFAQKIPLCQLCNPGQESPSSSDLNADDSYRTIVWRGIMKPDIVFFGEDLPEQFHLAIDSDRKKCDLLIVIGSSLKVRPVALIPNSIPNRVPQILINRETLSHLDFDLELLGNSDTIINQLCYMVGDDWTDICCEPELKQFDKLKKPVKITSTPRPASSPNSSADSSDGDYRSVMQMSIDSGFDSSSNPSTSSVSMASSSPISDTEYPATLSSDDSSSLHNQIENCAEHIEKPSSSVERHMSVDSTKDSAICGTNDIDNNMMLQSEPKKSIAEYLPANTYCRYRQHSYIFPGAEIFWDSDDDDDDEDDDDEDEDQNDEDNETVPEDINTVVAAVAQDTTNNKTMDETKLNFNTLN